MKEEWLFPEAVVPVDAETTAALVAEIHRLIDVVGGMALAQPEQAPVEYQMRMRPTWEVSSWSDWKKCSRDAAGDYDKTPKLHDWEYETRKLYARPITQRIPQIPQEHSSNRQWVGLTEWEREAIAVECGAMSADWLVFMEAVEKALKEKNT